MDSCIVCGLSLCVGHISASVYNIFTSSPQHGSTRVFQAIHCTVSLTRLASGHRLSATVLGYTTISIIGCYSLVCVSGGLRRLRVDCCRRVLWRAHPSSRIRNFWTLQDLYFFWILQHLDILDIFPRGATAGGSFLLEATLI